MKGKEIKEAFDEGYKSGVEAERARARKMLDQCRGVYRKEAWQKHWEAGAKGIPLQPIGEVAICVYRTAIEKMLSDKATAMEYAIFVVCEWSVGPDFKENWMPLRF